MTRIGRYDNPYLTVDWHRPLPPGAACEPLQLVTADQALSRGWLWRRGGERSVACLMHPRADFSRHYAVPALLDAGFAVLCQNSRWLNNDATLIHERLVFDVAAGLAAMRERYERVVLIGNSGGGSLYTFYLSQALAPAGARLRDTAAGEPLDLNERALPGADAMVYLAAHPGEGWFLLHAIDPSVASEGDPVSCDPALDLYAPANGFAPPPRSSRYAPEFLARYRAAQRARVERIDALARERVARRRAARAAGDARAAIATDFLLVYRTDADPRAVDLSLDPSSRDYGSLWGRRPDLLNYGPVGFARVVSPEAWLSTWSGLSSRAEMETTGPRMTLPALVVDYAGDNAIYPSDTEHVVRSLGSKAVERRTLSGDHYGFPAERGRDAALEEIAAWLRKTG
jgi:hypothetical protein